MSRERPSAALTVPEAMACSALAMAAPSGGVVARDVGDSAGEVRVPAVMGNNRVVGGLQLAFEVCGAAGGRSGRRVPVSAEVKPAVRGQAPDGREVTREVPVPSGTVAGGKLQLWTDLSGDFTTAPLLDSQVAGQAVFGELLG